MALNIKLRVPWNCFLIGPLNPDFAYKKYPLMLHAALVLLYGTLIVYENVLIGPLKSLILQP
jgi:hypothetical protein